MGAVTPQLATRLTTGKWFLQVALMPEIRTMVRLEQNCRKE